MNIAEIQEHKNANKIHFEKIVGYTTMVLNPSYTYMRISNALDDSEDDHVSDDQPVVELDSGTVGEESEEDEAEENDSDADADELGDPFSDDSDADFSLHVCLSQLFCVECFCNCCSYVNMHDLWKCPNCVHSPPPPPPPPPPLYAGCSVQNGGTLLYWFSMTSWDVLLWGS